MWVQSKFEKKKKFERNGVIKCVNVPVGKSIIDKRYNLKVSKKQKSIDIVDGTNSIIITDEIGISNLVEFSILFIKDAMLFVLHKGVLYVKDKNENIMVVNNKGKVTDFSGDSSVIVWKNRSQMLDYSISVVGGKYHLDSRLEKIHYLDNIILKVTSYFRVNNGNLFGFSVTNLNTDLGLNEFNFVVKESKVVKKLLESDIKFNRRENSNKDDIDSYIESNSDDESFDDLEILNNLVYYDREEDYT